MSEENPFDQKTQNEYLMLIQKMKDLKESENREMTPAEIEETLQDFDKEQEDTIIAELAGNVEFKKPPKTVKEALQTLQEVD